jgi:hypothetical protein
MQQLRLAIAHSKRNGDDTAIKTGRKGLKWRSRWTIEHGTKV